MLNANAFFSDDKYEYDFGTRQISKNSGRIGNDLIHILITDKQTEKSLSFTLLDDLNIAVDALGDEMIIDQDCAVYDSLVSLAYEDIIYKNKRIPVTNPVIMGDDSKNTLKVTKLDNGNLSFKINRVESDETRIMLKNTFYKIEDCDCDRRNSDYKRRAKKAVWVMFDTLKMKVADAIIAEGLDEPNI
ncbi:MAG: hypothetical protein K6F08_04040 [bacterium]|nr:hypothetical protein [bacterium]